MYRHLVYYSTYHHHTSPRGLAVTDAPKWVCAARRRPSANHARPLHLRLHPYPNLQAAPFGLCRERSSARCPLLLPLPLAANLLACCLLVQPSRERALPPVRPVQSSACLPACLSAKQTHRHATCQCQPAPASSISHPAKALHLTSTDCSGALSRDVYESQLDPVSVCHPTPQSALIVAVQTLLTSPPATCTPLAVCLHGLQPTAS